MTYRIEYDEGRCSRYVYSRAELLEQLQRLSGVTDIKRYKGGTVESVLDKYRLYIKNEPAGIERGDDAN